MSAGPSTTQQLSRLTLITFGWTDEDGPHEPQPGLRTFVKEQLTPKLGVGPFRYFASVEEFEAKRVRAPPARSFRDLPSRIRR